MPDYWIEPNALQTWSPERLGYPTQKPEALLERIIRAASNPGDVVLERFCGCGTTIAVAERLDRRWVGIDISSTAIEILRRRLIKQSAGACDFRVVGTPTSIDDLRALKPFEFQNWVVNAVGGTHSKRKTQDMGIDGLWFLRATRFRSNSRIGSVGVWSTRLRRRFVATVATPAM